MSSTKLYQISEPDLETLERLLPLLHMSLSPEARNADNASWRQIKRIVSDVRWEYGPHTDVKTIKDEDNELDQEKV